MDEPNQNIGNIQSIDAIETIGDGGNKMRGKFNPIYIPDKSRLYNEYMNINTGSNLNGLNKEYTEMCLNFGSNGGSFRDYGKKADM